MMSAAVACFSNLNHKYRKKVEETNEEEEMS